ncbi:MAG: hypothetical protein AB7O53_18285, partial [Thermoleophilia bacterium]
PMAYDDEEPEPRRITDPEELERSRESIRDLYAVRRTVLRWVYAGLGVLAIVVIVLALTR